MLIRYAAMSTRTCWAGHNDRRDDDGEDDLDRVECAKNQAPDPEPDLPRHVGCAELQRRFQKRDGQHHPQPYEGEGDDERRSWAHRGPFQRQVGQAEIRLDERLEPIDSNWCVLSFRELLA